MNKLFVGLTLLVAASAHAQIDEQRMDVKGMNLGATLADMRGVAKLKCGPDQTKMFDTVCRYTDAKDQTFAGQRAASVVFGLFDDRLDSVEFEFSGDSYDSLKHALNNKFGEVDGRGLPQLRSYMMNGDRAHLMYREGYRSTLYFQAAAGVAEREKRLAASKARVRKDM